jgi:tRNA-2-methylthio-N6-dimethylallyladenosine synthase
MHTDKLTPDNSGRSPHTTRGEGVFISTYGCQMNVNDTDRMHALLEMMNIPQVSRPEDASLIIINSCSVREKAVHKVHSEAGKYKKLKDKRPDLKIGVGGCVGQQEKGKLLLDVPVLDFVFGTDSIDKLPQIVQEVREKDRRVVSAQFTHAEPYQIETLVKNPGVATFVNIMKGCDNFCTFCVVPFTRGREKSRATAEILLDVHKLIARGVKEVTLLGQNVNSYKSPAEDAADFGQLLRRLATETAIERIRYTTSHPKDFNLELAHIMRDHREKVMEYIHLPAQSGNTEVLARMNRGYTREEYIAKAHMLLKEVPGSVLSTDIIVGFPGETDEQFEDTMRLLEEVPYESIYAFKYSPRPNTKASKFTDQVPEEVKSERLTRLLARHREIAFEISKKYLGQDLHVLVEEYHQDGDRCFGRSTQNKSVHFQGSARLVGTTVPVRITQAFPSTLHGELAPGFVKEAELA